MSFFSLDPYYDYVVVEQWEDKHEEITPGGIIKPLDTNNNPIVCSKVVAVGEGHFLQNGEVKPLKTQIGDLVYYNKFTAAFSIENDHDDFYFLHERDILARISKDDIVSEDNDDNDSDDTVDDDNAEEEEVLENKELSDEKVCADANTPKKIDVVVNAPTIGMGSS